MTDVVDPASNYYAGPCQELDATGLICPEPVMLLHNRMRTLSAGEVLCVRATDPASERDVSRFCEFLGHTLLAVRSEERLAAEVLYSFWIKKKSE